MVIMLDYERINKMMREMMLAATEVKNEIENMEETIEDLGIFWASNASNEYAMRVNTDLYTAKAMLIGITAGIKTLAESVVRFDAAERGIREMIEGM